MRLLQALKTSRRTIWAVEVLEPSLKSKITLDKGGHMQILFGLILIGVSIFISQRTKKKK